jgi:hypothetical protein
MVIASFSWQKKTLPDPLSLSERAREMLTIDAKPTKYVYHTLQSLIFYSDTR